MYNRLKSEQTISKGEVMRKNDTKSSKSNTKNVKNSKTTKSTKDCK